MDQTAIRVRRTLLCAFFVCPAAAFSMIPAMLLQTVCAVWNGASVTRYSWYHRTIQSGLSRVLPPLFTGLTLAAALNRLSVLLYPAGLLSPLLRMVWTLAGILLQASIIWRMQKPGRRQLAACPVMLLIIIACTR